MNPVNHLRHGGAPIAVRRPAPARGLPLRLRTWWRASALDDELAGGADPLGSDELSLRTGQLRSIKSRTRLARSLLAALELADRELPDAPIVRRLIRRPEVAACRGLILELAERLRDDWRLNAQGLAMISQLVTRGDGPLYDEQSKRSLPEALRSAFLALDIRLPLGAAASKRRVEEA